MEGIIGSGVPFMETYVRRVCRENGREEAERSLGFMPEKHAGQRRSGRRRLPYSSHPLSVCMHALLPGIREEDVACTCLLHDVAEDCGVKPEELPVNGTVRRNVVRLSRPAEDHDSCRGAYFEAVAGERISCLVKCIDRCHNVSSMQESCSVAKLKTYGETTRRYVFPLLDRLAGKYGEARIGLLLRYQLESVLSATDRLVRTAEGGRT